MRHVVYSAWRVFYSCFLQGAWSCLNQDMDFERHATLLFCAKSANVQGDGAEKERTENVSNKDRNQIVA